MGYNSAKRKVQREKRKQRRTLQEHL
jgi:hypothetical protein